LDVTGDVVFNTVVGKTPVHVGHADSQLTDSLGLATNEFVGTLGELVVDGQPLPLWVFSSSSSSNSVNSHHRQPSGAGQQVGGGCEGAPGPPAPTTAGHMFRCTTIY
jgi:hypothetical protein